MLVLVLVASERIYDKYISSTSSMTNNQVNVLYSKNGTDNSKKNYWDHHYMDGNLDGVITVGELQRQKEFTWFKMKETKPIYNLLNECSKEDKELIYGLTFAVASKAVNLSSSEKKELLNLDLISRVNVLNKRFNYIVAS